MVSRRVLDIGRRCQDVTFAVAGNTRERMLVSRGMNTTHPNLHLVEAVCSTCGTVHIVRTAAERVSVDTCSSCHPAYTGVERAAATGSRIDSFNRRRALATSAAA